MEFDDFYKEYLRFKDKQTKQKSRGLNDYNIFTALLSYSDEVRLHSRFIYSLINPQGEHYQGTLFLELFLESLGLSKFGLNLKSTVVQKEYKQIDLYITDGNKHIIIENKIFAGDQKEQIKRYIQTIVDEHKNEDDLLDRIYVVYLSLDREKPSDDSILGYELRDGKWLVNSEGDSSKIPFKAALYKKEIRNWLDKASKEVANLSNLSQMIAQYKQVIDKLYNEYRGQVMGLEEFVGNDVGKWKILNEMADKRNELVFKELDNLATMLMEHFRKHQAFQSADLLEKVQVLRKGGKEMYADGVYINFVFQNKFYFQLDYDLKLSLRYIILRFGDMGLKRKEEACAPKPPIKSEYNLITLFCDDTLQKEWVDRHDDIFINQVSGLIKEHV